MKTQTRGIGFGIAKALYLVLLLITCGGALAPFVPVHIASFLQVVAASFPFLFILHLLFLLFFLRKSVNWLLYSLLGIGICIWVLNKDIRWRNIPVEQQVAVNKRAQKSLTVMSFNVGTFDYDPEIIEEATILIKELDPDVLTLQEFRNHLLVDSMPALDYLAQELGLQSYEFVHLPVHIHGAATYSRYPIVGLDTLFMPSKEINSGILSTIETPIGKIGVGNLHLSSFHVAQTLDQNDGWKAQSRAMYQNTSEVLQLQQEKVKLTLRKANAYPYPLILTGDLNAPPHSRIVQQFSDLYQDSFLKAGSGRGWTFPLLGPIGMRIDYQFSSDELEVMEHEVIRSEVSDHFPLVVTYRLNP